MLVLILKTWSIYPQTKCKSALTGREKMHRNSIIHVTMKGASHFSRIERRSCWLNLNLPRKTIQDGKFCCLQNIFLSVSLSLYRSIDIYLSGRNNDDFTHFQIFFWNSRVQNMNLIYIWKKCFIFHFYL